MQFKKFFNNEKNNYDAYVSTLVKCSPKVGVNVLCNNKLPIYRATVNPGNNQSIFVVGGIHGNEIGGITGMLEYLKQGLFPENITLEFFPILNPTGFLSNNRLTDDGKDLNRDMCKMSKEPQIENILDLAKTIKPKLFWTLHEDGSSDKFYMYYSDEDKKPLYNQCVEKASQYFPILDGFDIHGDKCINGLISHPKPERIKSSPKHGCSVENGAYENGLNYLTTETPMKESIAKRTLLNKKLIEMIINGYS